MSNTEAQCQRSFAVINPGWSTGIGTPNDSISAHPEGTPGQLEKVQTPRVSLS